MEESMYTKAIEAAIVGGRRLDADKLSPTYEEAKNQGKLVSFFKEFIEINPVLASGFFMRMYPYVQPVNLACLFHAGTE